MKIINLIENTAGKPGCIFAHGLSFYVQTAYHRLLMDLGPSEETLHNADVLGIDLKAVDTVVLSHGHYDHSGGIIPFSEINDRAVIYMQSSADGEYYADDGALAEGDRYRYIGIDKKIPELSQVVRLSGDHVIDEELELFTVKHRTHQLPFTNRRLLIKNSDGFVRDDFAHEHYLVVREEEKTILISGCAHNGILSIIDAYAEKYSSYPDVVISGFHLMKKTPYRPEQLEDIRDIAKSLNGYPSKYYTCHCTGLPAYDVMKEIMGDKLSYIHSGEEVIL